jgi:hypothetical protein
MAPIHVRFSPGFRSGEGFHGKYVFHGFSGAAAVIRTTLEQAHFTFVDTLWNRISRRAFLSQQLLRSARTMLEQSPLREILLLRGIPG